ncbi:ATP-grasp domain-containing protein [Tissierella pigra]|uniref:ATP-grasp domain-containing protein n=2 Tax=Tissierella pigra TaxID=2607614 RepID=A0A6N7XGL2_9FIRM|nr:ATP-grasp domain-containing protein [Tissierella pigra]MSU01159.1 ATP-grasp domain-containing protein [Tissierella pigra]
MRIVTFNPFRTLGMPNVTYIKPENMLMEMDKIKEADYILFPEYWQVNTLVYGLKKKIFPNISTYQLGHNKVETTRVLQAIFPKNIPYTQITSKDRINIETIEEEFGYPLVAKEIKSSMGRGVFLVENREELKSYIETNESIYIQEKLPIDRDIRIVYVGDKVIGAYWRIAGEGQFHNNIAKGATYDYDNVPKEAIELVENVAKELNINHAGFDVVVVDNRLYILEYNVMFGNEGLRNMGISVEKYIYEYISRDPDFTPINPTFPRAS